MKRKIRKDDQVVAISGNEKGRSGPIIAIKGKRAVVQGLNVRKKHMRGQGQQPGQILEIEAPIDMSNLSLCDEDGKPIKVKVRENDKGERELFYRKDGKEILYRPVMKPKA
jgi:large subunit ribosomal protein L24